MSQHFSSIQQNLFKTLEADIFKFKQHGPPAFQLNIPCKYKEQCKYGRYSCNYSHDSFCKFQKKGKKCLNAHCTYNHELPLEYRLAQAFLTMKIQFPSDFSSLEPPISASECQFLSNSSSQSGTSERSVFRFKVNDSPANLHENNPTNNVIKSCQPQNKAETQFTAFSPLFQNQASSRKCSADYPSQLSSTKPTQTDSKIDRNSPPISLFCPPSAQKTIKTSEIQQETAHQLQGLPPRIFASKQLPPPVNQPQKVYFQPQNEHTTRANLILATSTNPLNYSSPVFTSKNKNSPANSTEKINFAAFPAAPAPETLYDVVTTANVRDYHASASGDTGDAANQPDPSLPSMESNPLSPPHCSAPGTPSEPSKITRTVDDPIISLKNKHDAAISSAKINYSIQTSMDTNSALALSSNPDTIIDKESQSVDDQIISQKKQPKAVTTSENKASQAHKPQNTTNYHTSAPKITPISATTKVTKQLNQPKREKPAPAKPHSKHEPQRVQPLSPEKPKGPVIYPHAESQAKISCFLDAVINQSTSSWNSLNETSSSSSEEEKPPLKTGDICEAPILPINLCSIGQSEQPVYLHPPNLQFPEDDAHFYYYPSDYPTYSHLQIICAIYKRTPINKFVIESLEYHEYQKSNLIQRELTVGSNIRNRPTIHQDIIKYAEFYHDYDPKAPENQSKKPYLMLDRNNPNIVFKPKHRGQQTQN